MFTGIIESKARVADITRGENGMLHATFETPLAKELKVDQSVAHNGVCLTVVECDEAKYRVDIIEETVKRSNFSNIEAGSQVNIERAMLSGARLDGHLVQGHVDCIGHYIGEKNGYWHFTYPEEHDPLVVMKGSICINGVSLTVTSSDKGAFSVALIPYTLEHTNLGDLHAGDAVNLEFDILGKYVQKNLAHLQAQ